MSLQVDPQLRREIVEFGGEDTDICMNCGNCTAVCPLSRDSTLFPRRIIRCLQLGLREKLLASVEPWLCYYCGECSDTCPRDANPGETMMAARRYLISQYDWTGLSRRLYVSWKWEIGLFSAVALFIVALFALFHGPMVTDRVELNTFAPVKWVELGDWFLGLFLSTFLLSNAYRMYRFLIKSDPGAPRIPLSVYLGELKTLVVHGLTQKRWWECEGKLQWFKHFLLVTGYGTMFLFIFVLLRWFQTDEIRSFWHPSRLLGYYATFALLYVTGTAMWSRLRKTDRLHEHSHFTDWMFLVLLFLTALTGIVLHAARLAGMPLLTYYVYVIHLAIAVPMLVVEVPFGKWAHLAYRPLAVYLVTVREKARRLEEELPAAEAEAAAG